MKQEHQIEKQIDDTLNSLDGISRAKANPFLFTRVEARLRQESKTAWDTLTSFVSRPVIALAMLCMVILSNAVAVYWQSGSEEVNFEQSSTLALTDEYNMAVTSFYEDETPEP